MNHAEYRFSVEYDPESDTLLLASKRAVDESVEIAEDIVVDLSKDGTLVGLEILYASQFFKAAGTPIEPKALHHATTATVRARRYRNYLYITILIPVDNRIIEEKLPPLALEEFESPLLTKA